ncbi:unnamed protein product [Nezara viridula]|uniref:Major facilitator superfamily (MFS) profile domain-containing protein n=1 Tax=Nezara viridula TaxID=85310 RepID=A0A9P0E2L3_NEZVI|nr:unnamed protein product [Nezara viridula]
MADPVAHWCSVPQLSHLTVELRRHLAIPLKAGQNNSWEECSRYRANWSEVGVVDHPDPAWPVEPCTDGWEFEEDKNLSSIVKDFELVCGKDIYPTIGLAGLNLGGPLGVYIFGTINDRMGRRLSFFLCLFVLIGGNVLTALATDFWSWAVARFIAGLTIPAVYQIPFIISLELVGPNYRSFVTVLTCLSYTLGLVLLSLVTYLIRDWRLLAYITSLPFLLYYLYWWFLPESPRWLLAKGRLVEALAILETLARVNGHSLPETFKHKLKCRMMLQRTLSEEQKLKKGPGVSSLCRTPNMRLKTTLITLNWFANEMVYVGLSYYGPALGDDQYLSFLLSCLVEVPSYLICWLLMDRCGRRWPLSLTMCLSGVASLVTVLLPQDAVMLTLILYLVSKASISASFLIIYPFAGELYPTEVRGLGIGLSAYIAGLGLIIIPFVNYLGRELLALPLAILGVISIIGGLSSLRLPETLNSSLPQTVEEGEEFGKEWSMQDCFQCTPQPRISNSSSYEDLDNVEMDTVPELPTTNVKPRLVRQASILETPLDSSGSMKITYWF